MLNSVHISHVFVTDQDEALDFYVGKLGLEVSNDIDLGMMRWLTVRVPGQEGRDILLEKPAPPSSSSTASTSGSATRSATTSASCSFRKRTMSEEASRLRSTARPIAV